MAERPERASKAEGERLFEDGAVEMSAGSFSAAVRDGESVHRADPEGYMC